MRIFTYAVDTVIYWSNPTQIQPPPPHSLLTMPNNLLNLKFVMLTINRLVLFTNFMKKLVNQWATNRNHNQTSGNYLKFFSLAPFRLKRDCCALLFNTYCIPAMHLPSAYMHWILSIMEHWDYVTNSKTFTHLWFYTQVSWPSLTSHRLRHWHTLISKPILEFINDWFTQKRWFSAALYVNTFTKNVWISMCPQGCHWIGKRAFIDAVPCTLSGLFQGI